MGACPVEENRALRAVKLFAYNLDVKKANLSGEPRLKKQSVT